jgi:hypothetical protein
LVAVSLLLAADTGSAQDTVQHQWCRDPHPVPVCRSYWLFEFNAAGNVAGSNFVQEFETKKALPSWFAWDVGWMRNVSRATSVGVAAEIGASGDGTRLALRAKGRRWLHRNLVVDASVGGLMTQRQTFDGVVPTYGATADAGFGRARLLIGTVGVDAARQQGRMGVGLHLGGRAESRGAILVSAAAAIGGLIVIAALSDGGLGGGFY